MNMLQKYKQALTPPYTKRDFLPLALTLLLIVGLIGIILIANQQTNLRSKAAGVTTTNATAQEAEDFTPSGNVTVGQDTNASGGKYIQLGTAATGATPTPTPTTSPTGNSLSDYYKQWSNSGPLKDPNFFPISVWLQDPTRTRNGKTNGQNYKDIGVNIFMNSYYNWDQAKDNALPIGMYALPDANSFSKTSSKVIGYTIEDEPDMNLKPEYGGCELPSVLNNLNQTSKAVDATRPSVVNFGKGVALPDYYGGNNCPWPGDDRDAFRNQLLTNDFLIPSPNNQPYRDWTAIPDVVSVDHYPTTDQYEPSNNTNIFGYGRSVRRAKFFAPTKPAWNFIQVTNINDGAFVGTISPAQATSAVWYSLVNGATGINYFAHCFNPLREDCVLDDTNMRNALKILNAQIQRLAPVLNSPTNNTGVSAQADGSGLTTMVKRYGSATYLFAIPSKDGAVNGTFTISGATSGTVEVVDEDRTLSLSGGKFSDNFAQYRHHIYKVIP